jgi:hypothetical protein
MLSPKIHRKTILPIKCIHPPCINIEVKTVKKGLIKLCWFPNKAAGITPKLYIALRLRSVGRVLCQRKIKQQIAIIE